MPRLTSPIPARWADINAESLKWSQGDLLRLPHTFVSFVPELPAEPGTRRAVNAAIDAARRSDSRAPLEVKDNEIFEGEPQWAVVVTQSCDIEEKVPNEPWFEASVVRALDDPEESGIPDEQRERRDAAWRRARAGRNSSRFAISIDEGGHWTHPELGAGRWYVDLRVSFPFEKGLLLQLARADQGPRIGVPDHLKDRFAQHIMQRYGRYPASTEADSRVLRPVLSALSACATGGAPADQILLTESLESLRFEESQADGRLAVTLYLGLTVAASEGDQRLRAGELVKGLVPSTGELGLSLRFLSNDLREIAALDYKRSHPLAWFVSEDDALSANV